MSTHISVPEKLLLERILTLEIVRVLGEIFLADQSQDPVCAMVK